jgi:predicted RNA-binding Zn-ribbon protein involved in translation (DUF1610 family)
MIINESAQVFGIFMKGEKMNNVCPLCNKLTDNTFKCNKCGGLMENKGRVQEVLLDDYTANMPINDSSDYCVHIFECNNCRQKKTMQIFKILI